MLTHEEGEGSLLMSAVAPSYPPAHCWPFPSGQAAPAPARPADGPPARGVSAGPPLGTQSLG